VKSPFDVTGPVQAEFTVFRTSSFLHAENIARVLAIYAELLQMFPAAVAVRSKSGPHEVRVSYGTGIGGERMLESLLSLKATVTKVVAGTGEGQPVIQARSDVVTQLPSQVFVGLHAPPVAVPAAAQG
jgi:hypothetical protein